MEPKSPKKKKPRTTGPSAESLSSASQMSSSNSESESEMSDVPLQPHPSSRLLVSRRFSQQQYALYEEGAEEEEEDFEKDVDIESLDETGTSCYSRTHMRHNNRPGAGAEQKYYAREVGEGVGKKVEQRRNIASLFQPQSPLIGENMKVVMWSGVCMYMYVYSRNTFCVM